MMGQEKTDTPTDSVLADFPRPVVEISRALAATCGERPETIALGALTVAGASLGNACRGTWDGITEHTGALQLALTSSSFDTPGWLGALAAPLHDQDRITKALSHKSDFRALREKAVELRTKYTRLRGRPGITDSMRQVVMNDATSYALATGDQTLLISHAHPWWADIALLRNHCGPLWMPGSHALGQWIQLHKNERSLLYRTLHGYQSDRHRLCNLQVRCPAILSTTLAELGYWINSRGKGIPCVAIPASNCRPSDGALPHEQMVKWKNWIRRILSVRAFTPSTLLSYSLEGANVLDDFRNTIEKEKESLPRKFQSRVDLLSDLVFRVSILLHFLNSRVGELISEETARAATRIGTWVMEGQLEVLREVGAGTLSPTAIPPIKRPSESEILYEKIRSSPVPLSRRQLQRKFSTMTAEKRDALLEELNEKKLLIYT